MNRIQHLFRKARIFLPVIHCIHETQARTNVDVAFENGADGVFLINQGGMVRGEVMSLAESLASRRSRPAKEGELRYLVDGFVGVNILGGSPASLIDREGILGIWSDDAGVHGSAVEMMKTLTIFRREREQTKWNGLWFGGVGFKYQRAIPDEWLCHFAVAAALGGVDVITTSGPGTGQPPSIDKIERLAEALDGHPIGIASGITPENVAPFLPFAQAFLVASGIERAFGELDAARTRALADAIHTT